MKKERNKAVPSAYLILKKDGKILLGRRKNTTYYDGWYGVPAGHVEANELPIAAIVREAKEEVGIDIDYQDVQLVNTLYRVAHDETGDRVDLFFAASKWRGEPAIMEPNKCDDLQWFPIDQLPENTIHHERSVLKNVGSGKNYLEIDKEHTHQNPSK